MRQKLDKNGYLMVTLVADNGKDKSFCVHSLVCSVFHGPKRDGQEVRHLDGCRINNTSRNLRWGTAQENTDDRKKHGTIARGNRLPQTRLTPRAVRHIRSSKATDAALAARFSVSKSHVGNIRAGRKWQYV